MVLRINDYSLIPDHLINQLILYIEEGRTPCSFLLALLSNDFMSIVSKADEHNAHILPIYAHFLHWECPMGCIGSYEKVDEWIFRRKGLSRGLGLKDKYWRGEQ